MIKNKFNIGQKVIVVQEGKVQEGLICSINQSAEKTILYRVKTVRKGKKIKSLHDESMAGNFSREMSRGFKAYFDPAFPPACVKINKYDERFQEFKEENIFEDEGDFRATVSIVRIPKKALSK